MHREHDHTGQLSISTLLDREPIALERWRRLVAFDHARMDVQGQEATEALAIADGESLCDAYLGAPSGKWRRRTSCRRPGRRSTAAARSHGCRCRAMTCSRPPRCVCWRQPQAGRGGPPRRRPIGCHRPTGRAVAGTYHTHTWGLGPPGPWRVWGGSNVPRGLVCVTWKV